jgi:hypothetical protein
VRPEIEWWITRGCVEYVSLYDQAVKAAFTSRLDIPDTNQPAIYNFNGTTVVPAHLFGELAKTEAGASLLCGTFDRLLLPLNMPDASLTAKRAVFFAVAHFASSPLTVATVESWGLADLLFQAAEPDHSPTYVLLGTLITCLSMFAPSPYFDRILAQRGWKVFKFACHQTVIPINPKAAFAIPKAPPARRNFAPYADLLRELKGVLLAGDPAEEPAPGALSPQQIAPLLHEFIGNFHFETADRGAMYAKIKDLPIVPMPEKRVTAKTATIWAQLWLKCIAEQAPGGWAGGKLLEMKVPVWTAAQLAQKERPLKYPEVFLSDKDFQQTAGMTRAEFYAKPVEQQNEVRVALVGGRKPSQ